jgi:hypothetical protein
MPEMPHNTSPSVRNKPVVFTALMTLALAAAVLTGASFSGVTSSAAQDRLRNPGFGRNGGTLAEQRRHAQALERIELAIGRLRADIALLNARIEEAGTRNREAANAAPVSASGNLAANDPGQNNPSGSGPEFDLGALRTSFEADAATPGERASRPHLRRSGKGGPSV